MKKSLIFISALICISSFSFGTESLQTIQEHLDQEKVRALKEVNQKVLLRVEAYLKSSSPKSEDRAQVFLLQLKLNLENKNFKKVQGVVSAALKEFPESSFAAQVYQLQFEAYLNEDDLVEKAEEVLKSWDKAGKGPGVEWVRRWIRLQVAYTNFNKIEQSVKVIDGIIGLDEMKKDPQAIDFFTKIKEDLALVGQPFTDFKAKSLEGKDVSVGALKGKVVLVDFWATWCGPCLQEMPNVQQAYKKYHGKGFEVIGISLDSDLSALKSFVAENSVPWVQICDGLGFESELARKYAIEAIPTTYLIDAEGKIIRKNVRGEALGLLLEKYLGK